MSKLTEINYVLKFLDAVVGKPGPIVLDTNIFGWADEYEGNYSKEKDLYTIGLPDRNITYAEVSEVFKKISKSKEVNKTLEKRDFIFEGFYKTKNNTWQIAWAS